MTPELLLRKVAPVATKRSKVAQRPSAAMRSDFRVLCINRKLAQSSVEACPTSHQFEPNLAVSAATSKMSTPSSDAYDNFCPAPMIARKSVLRDPSQSRRPSITPSSKTKSPHCANDRPNPSPKVAVLARCLPLVSAAAPRATVRRPTERAPSGACARSGRVAGGGACDAPVRTSTDQSWATSADVGPVLWRPFPAHPRKLLGFVRACSSKRGACRARIFWARMQTKLLESAEHHKTNSGPCSGDLWTHFGPNICFVQS